VEEDIFDMKEYIELTKEEKNFWEKCAREHARNLNNPYKMCSGILTVRAFKRLRKIFYDRNNFYDCNNIVCMYCREMYETRYGCPCYTIGNEEILRKVSLPKFDQEK
jgi:hypothetical protein